MTPDLEQTIERLEIYAGRIQIIPAELVRDAIQLLEQQRQSEYDLKAELMYAKSFLYGMGYTRCDMPACNCNSYHRFKPPKDTAERRLNVGEMELEFRAGFGWWLSREDGEGAQIQDEDVERMLSEFLGEVM